MRSKLIPILACLCCVSTETAAQTCKPSPAPVLRLDIVSRYSETDDSRSVIDAAAEAAAKAALDPLDEFLRDLAQDTNAMLKAEAEERAMLADCLIERIAVWARADALNDLGTETAQLTVGSRLASFGVMAHAAAPHTNNFAGLADVRTWLAERMAEQMVFWERAPRGAAQGNLRAWAGLAGAATAGLTNDVILRSWATWSVAYVLCTAEPDGSLPQEMRRGRLALHYQLHALSALVTAVLLLERQDVAIKNVCDDALARSASFALNDLDNGRAAQSITGEVQSLFEEGAGVEDFQIAWLEAYLLLVDDPLARGIARARRPLSYSKLGGNQTTLWKP